MRALLLVLTLLGVGLSLAACDAVGSDAGEARITVRLTDAPFPFDLADSANVSIVRIELLAAEADGAEADGAESEDQEVEEDGERIVLFDAALDGGPQAFNLLDLRDGVTAMLVDGLAIPSDRVYRQVRVVVGEDASVVFNDGSRFDLKVPSGSQSGVKIDLPAYELDGEGEEIDLLIDFNVEESFVTRGNPAAENFQGFLFKPVLKVESFEVEGPEGEEGADSEGDETGDESDDSDDGEG